jgi:hypothetical protein
MEVESKIRVVEVNNKDVSIADNIYLQVKSHWNYNDFVVLRFRNESVTVRADKLERAIANATNH